MYFKHIATLLFTTTVALHVWAQTTFTIDNLEYTVTDAGKNEVSVGRGLMEPTDTLIIPSKVINDGVTYTVTSLKDAAFHSCSGLVLVMIPNTVARIGKIAFFNCSDLKNVSMPDSIAEIGECAFQGCKRLLSLRIPDGVENIAMGTFYECSGLNQ